MRLRKILSNFLLILLIVSTVAYPQTGVSATTFKIHEVAIKENHVITYDSILNLLEKIESGELEKTCGLEELKMVNNFIVMLAREGVLPDEADALLDLENDIEDLLAARSNYYEYGIDSVLFYGSAEIILCKGWFSKRWCEVKKFVREYKKEIIVGAAIVVAVALVVGVAVAISGTAAVAVADKPRQSEDKPSYVPIKEEVVTFKESIVSEGFFENSKLSLEDSGRVLEKAFVKGGEFKESLHLVGGERAFELYNYKHAMFEFDKAININPNNHLAYLEKAITHLEMGEYDNSIENYKQYVAKKPAPLKYIVDFTVGFSIGVPKGAIESGSQLRSFASSCVIHPITTAEEMFKAFTYLCKLAYSKEWNVISQSLAPEIHELVTKWDSFTPLEQGELAGFAFGKHGGDIFIPGASAKLVSAGIKSGKEIASICRTLDRAKKTIAMDVVVQASGDSRMLAETVSQIKTGEYSVFASKELSVANITQIRMEISQHANLKIQWDKQGKHVESHRNFQPFKNRSVFEYSDPQRLADEFYGKGIKIGTMQHGFPGCQELVNFNEFIGYSVERETGKKTATSWGKIHYAKDGIHIVPTEPRL